MKLSFLLLLGCALTFAVRPSLSSPSKASRSMTSHAAFTPEMERRAFRYFLDQADPHTGLVKDRAANFGKDTYIVGSIAATGFGLAALTIGAERGYLPKAEAKERILKTLRFAMKMKHEHGWFYHFVDIRTGERHWNCELSSIDTALFMAGILAAGQYFHDTEIHRLSRQLYERIDFNWMRTDGGKQPDQLLISHGWFPDKGFLSGRWDHYDEMPILYMLAFSSPTHPIPKEAWTAWKRERQTVGPYTAMGNELPLFVHQYFHCFADVKGMEDIKGDNFWENTVNATLANRWYCVHRAKFPGFGPNGWGLSAGDGPDGYRAYGPVERDVDGTLFPVGLEAAVLFAPDESLKALEAMKAEHGEHLWGKYGFGPYNLSRKWYGEDIIGIDVGAALLLLDRYHHKDAFIPHLLEAAGLSRGLKAAGFHKVAAKSAP